MPLAMQTHMQARDVLRRLSYYGLEHHTLIRAAFKESYDLHIVKRRPSGQYYLVEHTYPVAGFVVDLYRTEGRRLQAPVVAGALLHDVLDEMLENDFRSSFGKETYEIVKAMERPDWKSYPGKSSHHKKKACNKAFKKALVEAPYPARVITLADRLNNILCIDTMDDVSAGKYVRETERDYLAAAEHTHPLFIDEFVRITDEYHGRTTTVGLPKEAVLARIKKLGLDT